MYACITDKIKMNPRALRLRSWNIEVETTWIKKVINTRLDHSVYHFTMYNSIDTTRVRKTSYIIWYVFIFNKIYDTVTRGLERWDIVHSHGY